MKFFDRYFHTPLSVVTKHKIGLPFPPRNLPIKFGTNLSTIHLVIMVTDRQTHKLMLIKTYSLAFEERTIQQWICMFTKLRFQWDSRTGINSGETQQCSTWQQPMFPERRTKATEQSTALLFHRRNTDSAISAMPVDLFCGNWQIYNLNSMWEPSQDVQRLTGQLADMQIMDCQLRDWTACSLVNSQMLLQIVVLSSCYTLLSILYK